MPLCCTLSSNLHNIFLASVYLPLIMYQMPAHEQQVFVQVFAVQAARTEPSLERTEVRAASERRAENRAIGERHEKYHKKSLNKPCFAFSNLLFLYIFFPAAMLQDKAWAFTDLALTPGFAAGPWGWV